MFITVAGTPAGYGYFDVTATPNENIIPGYGGGDKGERY